MLERDYRLKVIQKIRRMFPSAIFIKADTEFTPGVPDLLILYYDFWAAVEIKTSIMSRRRPRPNQEHYVEVMNDMSFSAFIYPENEEEVLLALQSAYESHRQARVS